MDTRYFKILEEKQQKLYDLNDAIWEFAETNYQETQSAEYFCKCLEEDGFEVERNYSEIPTAFLAEYGSGSPVIAFLAEYDALPNLGQEAGCLTKKRHDENTSGHGCSHNALGMGSYAGALVLKDYLEKTGHSGTVRLYGCPAEEGGFSKAFLVRDGKFEDVDAVLAWHPDNMNYIAPAALLATILIHVTFKGKPAHAALEPDKGRSALDAAELMNVGANFLREHMSSNARIHYAFLDAGGEYANVVQDHTKMLYQLRAPKMEECRQLLARIEKIAQGAAMMTETEVEVKIDTAVADLLPNYTLERLIHKTFEEIGMFPIDEEDLAFAEKVREILTDEEKDSDFKRMVALYGEQVTEEMAAHMKDKVIQDTILPYHEPAGLLFGSTDVGDVSQVAPTAQISTAGRAAGTTNHSWMVTLQGKTPLMKKSAVHAGKIMGMSAIELLENPEKLKEIKEEFEKRTKGIRYQSILPKDCCPYKK